MKHPKFWNRQNPAENNSARIEFFRIAAPAAILGFFAIRFFHGWEWLSIDGFRVPDLEGKDYRQPLYLPPLSLLASYILISTTIASGIFTSIGLRTRTSATVFASCLFYLALSDRMGAFTVTKIAPLLMLWLALSPAGIAASVDAALGQKSTAKPDHRWSRDCIRFLQAFLLVFYTSSGIAKARGDWLEHPYVLWTHLHDSYQTPVSLLAAQWIPAWGWTALQAMVLAYELGAILWFCVPNFRPYALIFGLGMHAFIGLGFGPVIWFSLLMSILLLTCFGPAGFRQSPLSRSITQSSNPS